MPVVWKGRSTLFTGGVNSVLVEQPDSPAYVDNDKSTIVQKYKGLHSLCVSSRVPKGTAGSGITAGYVLAECTVNRMRPQIGELILKWEGAGGATGQQLNPDTFGLRPTELNPRLEKHPLFDDLTDDDRELVRAWVDASTASARDAARAAITGTTNETLSLKLGAKLLRGQDSYYLAGWTYFWTSFWWTTPTIVDGGYIETPGGPLAGLLGSGLQWLRMADEHDCDGVQHRLTRSWRGVDAIDSELYA